MVGKELRFEFDAGEAIVLDGPDEQGVKRCPSRVSSRGNDGFAGIVSVFSPAPSYGYNEVGYVGSKGLPSTGSLGLGGVAANGFPRPLSEAEVRVPSDMIALGDNLALLPKSGSVLPADTVMEANGMYRQETSGDLSPDVRERVKLAAARHRNRGNVVFADGHVEVLTFRRLFLDRDDASLRRWNKDNEPHR